MKVLRYSPGTTTRARSRRRKALQYLATDNLERARAVARSGTAKALSDVSAAAERLARYQDSLLAEAKKSADSAEFAYKNGAIGVMDLLDARRTLRAIQLDAASAQADTPRRPGGQGRDWAHCSRRGT